MYDPSLACQCHDIPVIIGYLGMKHKICITPKVFSFQKSSETFFDWIHWIDSFQQTFLCIPDRLIQIWIFTYHTKHTAIKVTSWCPFLSITAKYHIQWSKLIRICRRGWPIFPNIHWPWFCISIIINCTIDTLSANCY